MTTSADIRAPALAMAELKEAPHFERGVFSGARNDSGHARAEHRHLETTMFGSGVASPERSGQRGLAAPLVKVWADDDNPVCIRPGPHGRSGRAFLAVSRARRPVEGLHRLNLSAWAEQSSYCKRPGRGATGRGPHD